MAIDLDDLFAYNTFKVVRVRDRYLGILRLILVAAIAVYIAVKVLYLDKAYNAVETPYGAVRSSLKMPTEPIDRSTLPYCSGRDWPFASENYSCVVWDENFVRFPPDEVDGIFITSRVVESSQEYACGDDDGEGPCPHPFVDSSEPVTRFVAGVEEFTLGLQHSFRSPTFSEGSGTSAYAGASAAFDGKLVAADGSVVKEFPRNVESDMPDVISLGMLLKAAGADLSNPSNDPDNSQRYSGLVLLVTVSYSNRASQAHTTYTYRASAIPNADYKLFETVLGVPAAAAPGAGRAPSRRAPRLVAKRAGPKVIFVISGELVRFDFQTLLIQLVSALGLLSVTTVVVELLMLYVMPLRVKYTEAKFEETEDFNAERSDSEADSNWNSHALVHAEDEGGLNARAHSQEHGLPNSDSALSADDVPLDSRRSSINARTTGLGPAAATGAGKGKGKGKGKGGKQEPLLGEVEDLDDSYLAM